MRQFVAAAPPIGPVRSAYDTSSRDRPTAPNDDQRVSTLMRHMAYAVSEHTRHLYQQGMTVPPELGALTEFLIWAARTRQDPPSAADPLSKGQSEPMSNRLLVTKGEAAERLSVSVRTIERLVSTGRLPQVHVERSARFRVQDLEDYVDGLRETTPDDPADPTPPLDSETVP